MAELDIEEQQVGNVTILDLEGEINHYGGGLALETTIRRLIEENKKKIVLNLAGVRSIDSSGNGYLIASYTSLSAAGGTIKFANLTGQPQNVLVITKLLTVYDVYDSVEEALDAFATEDKYICCPVRGCDSLILVCIPELAGTCTSCGTELSLRPSPSGESNQVSITSLRLPTYEREHINIDLGAPTTICILGRLDLFASEVLEKAWLTVRPPRRVIFRINLSNEVSPAGVQRLLGLCASKGRNSKGVIVPSPTEKAKVFPADSPVYVDERSAIEALGDIPDNTAWLLTLVTVQH